MLIAPFKDNRIFQCLIDKMITLLLNGFSILVWWRQGDDFFFLTSLHRVLSIDSINATALCRVLEKWCDVILECSPLIVKCLLIILRFRTQRTHLLESLPHFPGGDRKVDVHIRTFFFFALKALLIPPFSFRTMLPTLSERGVGCPAVSVNQLNPFATTVRQILPSPLQSPLFSTAFYSSHTSSSVSQKTLT